MPECPEQIGEHLECFQTREHGRDWMTCFDCGAQWSVVETSRGVEFEQISDGDGFCLEAQINRDIEEGGAA